MIPLWIGLILVAFVSFFTAMQADTLARERQSARGEQLVTSLFAYQRCVYNAQITPTYNNRNIRLQPNILRPFCPTGYLPNDNSADDIWNNYMTNNQTYYVYTVLTNAQRRNDVLQIMNDVHKLDPNIVPTWGIRDPVTGNLRTANGITIPLTTPIPPQVPLNSFVLIGRS